MNTNREISKEETLSWISNNFGMSFDSLMPKNMMEAKRICERKPEMLNA